MVDRHDVIEAYLNLFQQIFKPYPPFRYESLI